MTGYLTDTNAISEFAKPIPEAKVLLWFQLADPDSLFASVITLGELRLGVEGLPPGRRRANLEEWLTTGLPDWFHANLLPVTKNIADEWGRLTIQAKRRGTPLAMGDGLIAATAAVHGWTVVTRNVKDFAGLGVDVLNPWEQ